MSAEVQQTVLRCERCNKPFDKQSTLKRHRYYCRSRTLGITSRARSCTVCTKGKTRCDNRRPQCSRCATKAIQCHYPANSRKSPTSQNANYISPTQPYEVASMQENPPAAESHQGGNITDDSVLNEVDAFFKGLPAYDSHWNNLDINFVDFLNSQMLVDVEHEALPSLNSRLMPSLDQVVQQRQNTRSPQLFHVAIPPVPSMNGPRVLYLRPNMMAKAKRSANLILSTLKSYPQGMIQEKRLPPFIHTRLMSSDEVRDQMEPLSNCLSLVHMISGGIRGSHKLFWKNVRMECEQLRADCVNLTRWGLLAALQALSIYILIRLLEGETEHNNIDMLLLGTVCIVAKQLVCSDIAWESPSALSIYGLETSWKEWVFEESRRRLGIVYRVIDMLVYFEPAELCGLQRDILLAPLPAKKHLWEAKSPGEWKAAGEKDPHAHKIYALVASGDIVNLPSAKSHCATTPMKSPSLGGTSRRTAGWEEWCSGMDGFGSIVMLAASLVD